MILAKHVLRKGKSDGRMGALTKRLSFNSISGPPVPHGMHGPTKMGRAYVGEYVSHLPDPSVNPMRFGTLPAQDPMRRAG